MIKSNPCKLCGSTYHTAAFCPKKPRKPIKNNKSKQDEVYRFLSDPKTIDNAARGSIEKRLKTIKKKSKSRSYYVKQLDKVFSEYIRRKDAVDGIAICVTCNDKKPWKNQQNGHYMSRGDLPTRWDETNCHVQCVACNVFKKGNYTEYALFMINKYGAEHLDELKRKAKSGIKIPTPVIKDMIEEYKQKVLQLQ